jgi:hypothetical protein
MVNINIRDKNFSGEPSSCHKGTNKHVEWEFGNTLASKSCFITDLCLPDVYKASGVKRKIAWILEPRAIHPQVYEWIEQNNKLFDFVLTFDANLLNRGENFLYYPHGRCHINGSPIVEVDTSQGQYNLKKSKTCSIIASSKNFTPGHQLRHKIIKNKYDDVDEYGYGYKPVESKRESLDEYYFSITIENSIQPGYWTEKIVDCFATQTIPIYWGDESVLEHFDGEGILFFKDPSELEEILKQIRKNGHEIYKSRQHAILKNYHLVEQYRIPEDWMYNKYPFLFN